MEIRYCLHAMFALSSGKTTIVIDPWNAEIGHPNPHVSADAVLVTHEHFDHNNLTLVGGAPRIVRGLTAEGKDWAKVDERIGPFHVVGVPAYHDAEQGKARGKITMMVIDADGVRVVHAADLGHTLSAQQVDALGRADILMLPVGGHYTCERAEIDAVIEQIRPRVVVPMHFKTLANADWPIGTLDDCLARWTGVKRVGATVTVTPSTLPASREIWAMV
jgi:L-ascorbate metabolism protein UlaG (beta-lactamase superfamily)